MNRFILVMGIIILFFLSALAPMSFGYDVKITSIIVSDSTTNKGTLSGYVNDTSMNPISGARVRVSFHGTYEEDYTDCLGYYHVTNIPICYCLKNCTASKEGFSTEEVWLSIDDNTTYDFILSCISFQVDANGPYFSIGCASIQFHGSAYCGSKPYTWHWDFGDGNTSTIQNPFHYYTNSGEYTVILSVTDNENNTVENITFAVINPYPWYPTISGSKQGKPGINYEYSFNALHPEADDISYYIEWDDGNITNWTPFLPCGVTYKEYHMWDSEGTYIINAKAKLLSGCVSAWSEFEIKITKPRTRAWLRFFDMFPILWRILKYIL